MKQRSQKSKIWQSRIKEIENSEETAREYCQRKNFSIHQYYYWRQKLKEFQELAMLPKEGYLTELKFATEKEDILFGLRVSFGNGIEIIPEKEFSQYEFIRLAAIIRSM